MYPYLFLYFHCKNTKNLLFLRYDVHTKKIKKMGKYHFIDEFKKFAVKGNAVDMAVGVIIGGAFGKIVSSIVNDIIMPPIGWLIGGVSFTDLKVTLPVNPLEPEAEPVIIAYGSFIQNCFDFIIIAFCVFLLVKMLIRLTHKETKETPVTVPPVASKEEVLLEEIRDILKKQTENKKD